MEANAGGVWRIRAVKGVDFLSSKSEFLDTIKLNGIKENPEVARLRLLAKTV